MPEPLQYPESSENPLFHPLQGGEVCTASMQVYIEVYSLREDQKKGSNPPSP